MKYTMWQKSLSLLSALGIAFIGQPGLLALPGGANVVSGNANFQQSLKELTIHNSDRAIIEWQQFSIGHGELTHFVQPSIGSTVLNRVTGGNLTEIYGTLRSNGSVYLINPNGVLIGASGVVDTNGFVASTLDVSNAQFLAGGTMDFVGESSAAIQNLGQISALEGDVFLIARQIKNTGSIFAPRGDAGLYAGGEVVLAAEGTAAVRVGTTEIDPSQGLTAIENSGIIEAAKAKLQAAGGNLYTLAINNSGTVRANGTAEVDGVVFFTSDSGTIENSGDVIATNADGDGGEVYLHAGNDGTLLHSGNIDVRGTNGGRAVLTGKNVGLIDYATINASGTTGNGGEVLIGGDYQGKNSQVFNATAAYFGPNAAVYADAGTVGDGGTVILWSDDTTRFQGHISARGGAQSGNGGFIETSGKVHLQTLGTVDASASNGAAGTWLIDPNNITITTGVDGNISGGPNFTTTNDSSILTPASILTILNAGTNVLITTAAAGTDSEAGNITIASNITKTAGGNASLTFKAHNSIIVNSGVTISSASGQMDIVLHSDSDNDGVGAIQINSGAMLDSNGGDIILGGGSDPLLDNAGATASFFEAVYIDNASITSQGGDISIRGAGSNFGTSGNHGVKIINGTTINANGGDILIRGISGNSPGPTDIGIYVDGAGTSISSNSGASISLDGTSHGSGGGDVGVKFSNGAVISGSDINVSIVGNGSNNGTGSNNYGVEFNGSNAGVNLSGASTLSITGTGGTNAGSNNHGVVLSNQAKLLLNGTTGNHSITGHAGTGGSGIVSLSGIGNIISNGSSTGNLFLQADSISFNNLSIDHGGDVYFKPLTSSIDINIGSGVPTSGLFLDANAIASIVNAALLHIGDPSSGSGTVNIGGITFARNVVIEAPMGSVNLQGGISTGAQTLAFISSGNITQAIGSTISTTGGLEFLPGSFGAPTVTINRAGNSIFKIAGDVHELTLKTGNDIQVASVNGSSGLMSDTFVDITATGSNISIDAGIQANTDGSQTSTDTALKLQTNTGNVFFNANVDLNGSSAEIIAGGEIAGPGSISTFGNNTFLKLKPFNASDAIDFADSNPFNGLFVDAGLVANTSGFDTVRIGSPVGLGQILVNTSQSFNQDVALISPSSGSGGISFQALTDFSGSKLTLYTSGNISQSVGAGIWANELLFKSGVGNPLPTVLLLDGNNRIHHIAGDVEYLDLFTSGDIDVAAINGNGSTYNGIWANDFVDIEAAGDISLSAPIFADIDNTSAADETTILLDAGGNVLNNAGLFPLNPGGGRFVTASSNPNRGDLSLLGAFNLYGKNIDTLGSDPSKDDITAFLDGNPFDNFNVFHGRPTLQIAPPHITLQNFDQVLQFLDAFRAHPAAFLSITGLVHGDTLQEALQSSGLDLGTNANPDSVSGLFDLFFSSGGGSFFSPNGYNLQITHALFDGLELIGIGGIGEDGTTIINDDDGFSITDPDGNVTNDDELNEIIQNQTGLDPNLDFSGEFGEPNFGDPNGPIINDGFGGEFDQGGGFGNTPPNQPLPGGEFGPNQGPDGAGPNNPGPGGFGPDQGPGPRGGPIDGPNDGPRTGEGPGPNGPRGQRPTNDRPGQGPRPEGERPGGPADNDGRGPDSNSEPGAERQGQEQGPGKKPAGNDDKGGADKGSDSEKGSPDSKKKDAGGDDSSETKPESEKEEKPSEEEKDNAPTPAQGGQNAGNQPQESIITPGQSISLGGQMGAPTPPVLNQALSPQIRTDLQNAW